MMEQEYSEEEGGETYIDPNDLNIISNDYNWEPTDDEIINYARQLGFDVENDPQEFLEIAYNYLKKPLPKDWKRAFQKDNGELLYIDMSTNEIHLSTQLEEMAKEEYLLNKREYEQKQRAEEEAQKKVIVVPRTKIPPIGAKKPKENKNQLKEKEFMQKLAKEKQKEDLIKQNEEIKVITSKIERKKSDSPENEEEAIQEIPVYDEDDNQRLPYKELAQEKDYDLIQSNDSDMNHRRKHYSNQPEVYENINLQGKYQKESHSLTPEKKNENSYVSVSPDGYATPERQKKHDEDIPLVFSKKSSSIIKQEGTPKAGEEPNEDYSSQKQEYLETKQAELRKYKQKLLLDFEAFMKNLNQISNEHYEQQFLKEKRSLKDKAKGKSETVAQTNVLEAKYLKEIDDYKQSHKRSVNGRNDKEEIERYVKSINDLKGKREELVRSIQIQRENNKIQRTRRIQSMKDQLLKEKFISEERIKIQKDSLFQKSLANISTIELRLDNQLRQQKDNLNASQSMSFGRFIKAPIAMGQHNYDAILQEHERFLEESLQLKKEEVEKEFLRQREKELEEQRQQFLNETQDRISFVNKEIGELEKEYYSELSAIRSKARMTKDRHVKAEREQLNGLPNSFDQLKSKHNSLVDVKIGEIVVVIQEAIRLSEGSNVLHSAESKCEEALLSKLCEANVSYQKSRTLYVLTEKDFKQKQILLMYFYDIASYLSKRLIERPLNRHITGIEASETASKESEDLIASSFAFGKATMTKCHNRYIASQSASLFSFLDNETAGFTTSAMPMKSFSQLMFSINPFDNKQEDPYPTGMKAINSEPLRGFPVNTFREHSERYPNQGLSQHDIIKEKEDQQNRRAQFLKKEAQPPIDTAILSQSVNQGHSNCFMPLNRQSDRSSFIQSNIATYESISLPVLPEEIKEKLTDEDFLLYSKIIDFLQDEETTLLRQEAEICNKRGVFDELSQFNEKGFLLQLSSDIFRERNDIMKTERDFKDKVHQYHLVKNLIGNAFNFIAANSTRTNFITEKLILLQKHIEEYKGKDRKADPLKETSEPQDPRSVSMCKASKSLNSFRKNPPAEPINIGAIHNQFTNFYSLYRPNTLSSKISTNFSHEFFNFKKNKEYVDYKLASTRYAGMNASSSRNYYV